MRKIVLNGWNHKVVRGKAMEPGPDGPVEVETWVLVLTEMLPQTGLSIEYQLNREQRDDLIRQYTDGIVIAGGGLPDPRHGFPTIGQIPGHGS